MGNLSKPPHVKSTAKNPRKNDPQGLRTRILDAAAELFQIRGYFATSMQDLMQAAEVTGGALHHHFPSKKSLGLAVIAERVAPTVRETWIEPLHAASSLRKAVSGVFAEIIASIETRGRVAGCPLNNLALELTLSDPQFRESINEVFAEWQGALAERLGATRRGARLERSKRMHAAAFIISSYSGAMTLAKTSQSAGPLLAVANDLTQWIQARQFVP